MRRRHDSRAPVSRNGFTPRISQSAHRPPSPGGLKVPGNISARPRGRGSVLRSFQVSSFKFQGDRERADKSKSEGQKSKAAAPPSTRHPALRIPHFFYPLHVGNSAARIAASPMLMSSANVSKHLSHFPNTELAPRSTRHYHHFRHCPASTDVQRGISPAATHVRCGAATACGTLDLVEWLEEQGYEPEACKSRKRGTPRCAAAFSTFIRMTSPWPRTAGVFGDELEITALFRSTLASLARTNRICESLPPGGELGLLKRARNAEHAALRRRGVNLRHCWIICRATPFS